MKKSSNICVLCVFFQAVKNFQDSSENIQWRLLLSLSLVMDAPSSIQKKELNRCMFVNHAHIFKCVSYSLSSKKIIACKTDLMTWTSDNKHRLDYSWPDHHHLELQRKYTMLLMISRNQFGYGLVQFESGPTPHTSAYLEKDSFQMTTLSYLWGCVVDKVLSPFYTMWKSLANYPENIFV